MCTLGPATSTPEKIRELVDAGMNVARLNLSHGSYEDHEKVYKMVRQASDDTGKAVGILVDLQGPKIRLGRFADGPITVAPGRRVHHHHAGHRRATRTSARRPTRVCCGDVQAGDEILIDDGRVRLTATAGRAAPR